MALTAADKLVASLGMNQTIDRMLNKLVPLMAAAVMGQLDNNPATQPMMQQIESQPNGRDKLMQIFDEEMLKSMRARYPEMMDGVARQYAMAFSAQQLNELITFFGTGVGAKWVALSPQLQEQVGKAAGEIGKQAGVEAGRRMMERAASEILPTAKAGS